MERIIIEVFMPEWNRGCDFSINTDIIAGIFVRKVQSVILRQAGIVSVYNENAFILIHYSRGCLLDMEKSMKEQGVLTGDRLLLI